MVRKIIEHILGEISNRRGLSIYFTAQHRAHRTHRTHRTHRAHRTHRTHQNDQPELLRGSSRVIK